MPPLSRGQGNERFRTADPRKAAHRGQTVPYDMNGAPTGAAATTLNGQPGSYYLARGNHTGTQLAATISDFTEAAQDAIASLLVAGGNISLSYNDVANTLTIAVTGLTSANISDFAEAVDDRVAALLVAGTNVSLSYNDAAGTLTIGVTGLTSASISDFSEAVDDRVAVLIQNGAGITWAYNDAGGTFTPTVTITQYTDEMAQDAVGTILTDSATIDFTYNDVGNSITAVVIDDSITFAKFQNISTAKVLGRATAGSGDVEELPTTGTGNVVLSASPTLTGTLSGVNGAFSGTLSCNGNATLGDASGDSHTINGLATITAGVTITGGSFASSAGTGKLYSTATIGLNLTGNGSTYDLAYHNSGGSTVFGNPTGTTTFLLFGLAQLASFTVAGLPAGNDGSLAFASNGRKTGEGAGAGTGVPVYRDGGTWFRFADDTAVAA